jgi:hypothetical protein
MLYNLLTSNKKITIFMPRIEGSKYYTIKPVVPNQGEVAH